MIPESKSGLVRAIRRNLCAISVLALVASAAAQGQDPGATFLEIWPTARSTALGGAMTGLADEPDAAYWNPGGLGFQKGAGLTGTYNNWLPGLYPAMHYSYVSAGYGGWCIPRTRLRFNAGLDGAIIQTTRELAGVDPVYAYLPTVNMAVGLHAGILLWRQLGIGLGVKLVRSHFFPDWAWRFLPELGITSGDVGSTVAADLGILYKPSARFSAGLALVNLGPGIYYVSRDETDPLPRTLRVGLCWTPVNNRLVRLRVLPEINKVLIGMFYEQNPNRPTPFLTKLDYELWSAWKSLGAEATILKLVSLRLGYFEDITGYRGGFVFNQDDGSRTHVALSDVLTGHSHGKLKSVGICWGVGIQWKDYVRLEVASDGAAYDFPTANTKFALTINDVVGLVDELSSRVAFRRL